MKKMEALHEPEALSPYGVVPLGEEFLLSRFSPSSSPARKNLLKCQQLVPRGEIA